MCNIQIIDFLNFGYGIYFSLYYLIIGICKITLQPSLLYADAICILSIRNL